MSLNLQLDFSLKVSRKLAKFPHSRAQLTVPEHEIWGFRLARDKTAWFLAPRFDPRKFLKFCLPSKILRSAPAIRFWLSSEILSFRSVIKSNERSEYSYIGLADFFVFFSGKSL